MMWGGPYQVRRAIESSTEGQRLDREHDPRHLAAGDDTGKRPQILPRVRRHEKFRDVDPLRGPDSFFGHSVGRTGEPYLEPRALHRQLRQQTLELARETVRDLPSGLAKGT